MQDEECNRQECTAAVNEPSGIMSSFSKSCGTTCGYEKGEIFVYSTSSRETGREGLSLVAPQRYKGPWALHVSSNVSMT
jgi:hypothetical protein